MTDDLNMNNSSNAKKENDMGERKKWWSGSKVQTVHQD